VRVRYSLLVAAALLPHARRADGEPVALTAADLAQRGDPPPAAAARPGRNVWLAIGEAAGVMLPSTIYYWSTTNLQKEDWELDWNWQSWRYKLTSLDSLIVDTGTWEANAMRHPLAGSLSYQAGRANGFGPLGSTLIDFLSAVTWEYFAEFKERISLNDIATNTASGFLIGEPLFQLGRIADAPGAGWARRSLAAVASPFHRLHAELGYGARLAPLARTRLELGLGGGMARHGDVAYGEGRVAIDAELVSDDGFYAPGQGSAVTGPGAWSRIAIDIRTADDGITGVRARSMTTYAGVYWRDRDRGGFGHDRFIGLAAGFDYETRRLAEEWDRFAAFHLLGPRLVVGHNSRARALRWETAIYGDLAMVQAHAFGPQPPFDFDLTSVLRARGYYYATGISAMTRLVVDASRWTAELEGRAYHTWSIDGFDRVELHGGPDDAMDPEWVADERFYARAAGGVYLDAGHRSRLEVGVDAIARRGTWSTIDRWTTEIDVQAGVALAF
jgi:hypothetical protein